jgi:hypothetical protein
MPPEWFGSESSDPVTPRNTPSLVPSAQPSLGPPDWMTDLTQYEEAESKAQEIAKQEGPSFHKLPLVDHGNPPSSGLLPLGVCEGHCNEDADCLAGLICFQRSQRRSVPGCKGFLNTKTNYCIRP